MKLIVRFGFQSRLRGALRVPSLVVSDLCSETKGYPGSSPATTYVQRSDLCSNRPANVQVSMKQGKVVVRSYRKKQSRYLVNLLIQKYFH